MKPDSANSSQSCLPELGSELEQLEQCLGSLARELHQRCCSQGEFDAALLDNWQQPAYDLALCQAELCAARALLEHVSGQGHGPLLSDLCLLFVTEVMHSISQRLMGCGLAAIRQQVLALLQRQSFTDLLDKGQDPEFRAAVGQALSAGQIKSLGAGLDADKLTMQRSFARFADEEVAPLAEAIHRQDLDIPEALLGKAAELGCFGSCIPQRFGGFQPDDGADSLAMIVVTEELSRASLGAAGSLVTRPEIAARALLAGGTQEQQQHWLPALASGQRLCAIAITEPDTGSDVAAVRLRARATDNGWLLSGSKTWSTFAGRSELLLVLARSEPEQSGHRGLSLFLLEKPAFAGHHFRHQQTEGGVLQGRAIATIGYRGMHSFELSFEDYFVPADMLVGGEAGRGKGFYYTMAGFAGGRIQTAARANGVMQAAYEQALEYCAQRQVFGQPLADYQLSRIKLARMQASISASRLLSHAVARELDRGAGQMQASLVKLFACRAAEWITREAMQLHGGMGYAEETAVSRYFVDARVLSIFEGAEEVLAIKVIARDLIEKAKEHD